MTPCGASSPTLEGVPPIRLVTELLLIGSGFAHALEGRFDPVADGVYAHIGDLGSRTADNEGLNANLGLVVTPAGAALLDSGATYRSARAIDEAARHFSMVPIRRVINTVVLAVIPVSNTQRWLAAFRTTQGLAPGKEVPRDVRVTDIGTGKSGTADYREALRRHMAATVDEGTDISTATRDFDLSPFRHLANATELHPGHASRTCLDIERE